MKKERRKKKKKELKKKVRKEEKKGRWGRWGRWGDCKWNREEKNLYIEFFLWLKKKYKCNGPKLNKMGLKHFKRNGSMD